MPSALNFNEEHEKLHRDISDPEFLRFLKRVEANESESILTANMYKTLLEGIRDEGHYIQHRLSLVIAFLRNARARCTLHFSSLPLPFTLKTP